MKQFTHLYIIGIVLLSCQYNNFSPDSSCKFTAGEEKDFKICLTGTWRLVETLIDPGNGTGTFQKVNFDKVITFNANGTFESTTNVCVGKNSTRGSYQVESSILRFADCGNDLGYHVKFENKDMTLSFIGCTERCSEKYERVGLF
jgi:hypothetical protein